MVDECSIPEGFLLVNKPRDVSSFYVVKSIKKLIGLKTLKIGHGGTLDPFATGLLIIGIGRIATRHLGKLLTLHKKYRARGKLGQLTDTMDATGTIIQTTDYCSITQEELHNAITQLGTSYTQTPPVYSALKHQGLPLYKYAREKSIDTALLEQVAQEKSRTITLHNFCVVDFSPPSFILDAHVSHGTYIRVLVNDIAKNVGSCATTTELQRTAVGSFTIEDAVDFEDIQSIDDIRHNLIDIEEFLITLRHDYNDERT